MKMLYLLHAYNKTKKLNCLINSWNIEGFKVFALHRFSFSALCTTATPKANTQSLNSSLPVPSSASLLLLQKKTKFFFDKPKVFEQKAAKQNDGKIVNFNKKHKLFNKKLSYLSSPFAAQEKSFTQGKGKAVKNRLFFSLSSTEGGTTANSAQEQGTKLVQMEYSLETFQRSNQDTCLNQKPSVFEGTWVQSGDLLTDCASSVGGELSLGQNLLIAYMPWEGYNFEDAILISERLVRDDLYTSVHIERYELETLRPPRTSAELKQQAKLGAEEITRNIPDVSEKEIQKLDSYGIIKLGSWVEEGDILVGKITPINKKTISPYQKLLYTILEKQVKPIKDSSLRAPKGIKAKVVDIKYFLRKNSMRNLTKNTTSLAPSARSSTALVKQEFEKKNKQSALRLKNLRFLKNENKSKKGERTLVSSSTVRLLEVSKSHFKKAKLFDNRQFWKSAFLLYKQKRNQNNKFDFMLMNFFKKFKKKPLRSAPSQKSPSFEPKGVYALHQSSKRRQINKTYFNFFYKTKTLATLPLLKQRKSLIVLNSFLPFLQRLNKKYKIQKSLDFLNYKNLYKIKAKSFFDQEKEQYIIEGKHFVKQNVISALLSPLHRSATLLQKTSVFGTLLSNLYRSSIRNQKVFKSTQTERQGSKFLKKSKLPILSLTYASGNKRKGYSKSCAFAFGGASLFQKSKIFGALCSKNVRFLKAVVPPSVEESAKNEVFYARPSGFKKVRERARKSEIIQNMETIHIYLAEKRKVQVGDKMAGRHGNKGIVSQILPIQDMPYLPDGTPIDMVLNPLGVPSRMNVGQIYECLLGLAGKYLGENYKIPSFDEAYGADASRSFVFNKLFQARMQTGANWLFDPNSPGKMRLYDGRNGECFLQPVTVGQAYILRLVHMVDDKIHARSTGPYSLVTQQPLRGRSKQGGQRLGEMEVWALEGYGAAFTLLEMLTIKSDDMTGRMTLWSNLILNKDIAIGTPESFKVLVCELQALCLDIGLFRYSQSMSHTPSTTPQLPVPGESEVTKQENGKDFNKFSLREINSLINLP